MGVDFELRISPRPVLIPLPGLAITLLPAVQFPAKYCPLLRNA